MLSFSVTVHGAPSSKSTMSSVHQRVTNISDYTQPSTTLTMAHHFTITKCLSDLGNKELLALGGALGLYYPHLQRMPLGSFMGDMLAAWLNREDSVMEASGDPSWTSLIKALKCIEQHGIAQAISQGISTRTYKKISSWNNPCDQVGEMG